MTWEPVAAAGHPLKEVVLQFRDKANVFFVQH
jgi:hypothetical protein